MAGDENPFREYLKTTGDSGSGFKLVNPSSPVQWGGLVTAILASIYTTVVVGLEAIINGIFSIPSMLFDALSGVIYTPSGTFRFPGGKETVEASGIIPTIWQGLLNVGGEMGSGITGYGLLSYPLVVAEILVALYIIIWSYRYATEEVL